METMALAIILSVLLIPTLIYVFPFLVGADASYTVMGTSMVTLQAGDLVIVMKVDPEDIEIGDVLTVSFAGSTVTHRVVEKIEAEIMLFRLKGEANEYPDSSLYEASQVIGKVVFVFPFSHLFTAYGFTLAVVVPFTLIVSRLREGRTPMRDRGTLLLFAIVAFSASLTISHYFLNLKAF